MDNINVENNVQNVGNVVKSQKNKPKLKKVAIILLIVSIVFIVLGFGLDALAKVYKEKKAEKNRALAQSIFEQTNMNDYLTEIFEPGVKLNTNLLDSKIKFKTDIYNDDSITKYSFSNSDNATFSWLYVKFEDYAAAYKKQFNEELAFDSIDGEIAFRNLVDLGDNRYKYDLKSVTSCTKKNIDICYIDISKKNIDNKEIKFDSFDMKEENIVIGKVNLNYDNENTKVTLIGNFELKVNDDNDEYVVEYLKITSLNDSNL